MCDITEEFLLVGPGKTGKRLRIRLTDGEKPTGLGAFLDELLERRALNGIKGSQQSCGNGTFRRA
ncbi:hypothetical protein D9M68_183130 [compost metagenome]